MTGLALVYREARNAADAAEYRMEEAIERIFGFGPLDDTWWDHLCYDPEDWDGYSVEFMGADAVRIPTQEQLHALWSLGFTVVRLFVTDSRSVSGDWWQVKGIAEPNTCRCSGSPREVTP